MKQLQKITENKELSKRIESNEHYSKESFIEDVQRYIKAIKEGRMICSVSASGMSRNIKFIECAKNKHNKQFMYLNFCSLFNALGYEENQSRGTFKINGCGMDMVFNTNYNNMQNFKKLGFINRTQCANLAQQTPIVI